MAISVKASGLIPGRYAAIDIGTVTCRLFVAEVVADGSLNELYRESVICDLGAGVDSAGHLSAEAIERVGAAVDGFVEVVNRYRDDDGNPVPVRAVATSASRDADNASDFKCRLAQSGLEFEVIPGEQEASLSFSGASVSFPGQRVVVVDSGGGSTEVIVGAAGGMPEWAHSFNVGCRRVTERFFRHDPPSVDELKQAREWVAAEFADDITALRAAGLLDCRMVAVAGTATSVISMRERMAEYDRNRVHGSVATRDDLNALFESLASMNEKQRREVVGLRPGRAPVIVAGLIILQEMMELAGVDEFTVSETDILYGIIFSMAREKEHDKPQTKA